MSTGAFHEALNQAAVERLPLVLVVANNQYAYSTPNRHQFACTSLLDRARGYGVAGQAVDGTDLTACLNALRSAVVAARAGQGPQLVVASLLRLCGHGEHDDASYITPEIKKSAVGRDCIAVAEAQLLQADLATRPALAGLRAECVAAVEQAVATVQREPAPDPFAEQWQALSAAHLLDTTQES
jgi:pyruvate dehydrogenase E1 component alpha subunit/2-oxoisovalerate dehydrogenase E1 component alpha subunit